MSEPRLLRRYDFDRPRPMVIEIHRDDCACPACAAEAPVDEPDVPAPLGAQALAKLALAGFGAGHLAAFVILGPSTAWHVLVAALTWQPL